ncbi:DUF4124 domain-containing protein [Massilia endophytica]|uniref:DUF4124 domain-containing protein n=1 Tax=Massilia endophytica TaxID=2899220 RepID=UPI001E3CFCE3|nr:DUF4124 domain-containing protein [Massilia endophytica]UGQ47429.1 DUF4124 domain-containing protein [Massilia endophytica]
MRRPAYSATLCLAAALATASALADDQIYKCLDRNGVVMLSDKPCEATTQTTPSLSTDEATLQAMPEVAPVPVQRLVVKEHYTLPPAEVNRNNWSRKPPVSKPPKVDVATLKAAKLNLELSERTASLR